MNIIIIGAGIGGLSAACLLANKGHKVTIFEKNDSVGGKLNEINEQGYRFDTGPSLFTMPYILDELLKECGTSIEQELELLPLTINCRYFFADGVRFDNFSDKDKTIKEIRTFADEDAIPFTKFLEYSKELDRKTRNAFVRNPLYDISDFKHLNYLSLAGIDAFTTVSSRIDKQFSSKYMRQFFKRFTTYNGSSPFQAPATLNVIPHIELNEGGYYIKGGMYNIAKVLTKIAISKNVTIVTNSIIDHISTQNKAVTQVRTSDGATHEADIVVANSDATETITKLLNDEAAPPSQKRKALKVEPSCSGYVLLLGISKKYEHLTHHNIFFSENYKQEFDAIFNEKVMPNEPTIYVANTSATDSEDAPSGHSNLFILVNAPYLSDKYNWEKRRYDELVIKELQKRGLDGLAESIVFKKEITPQNFYDKYLSNKGSIYGTSSNSKWSAFVRPRNKSKKINGLYFVGGSTHPGGGIPLVIQSAFNASKLIERYE